MLDEAKNKVKRVLIRVLLGIIIFVVLLISIFTAIAKLTMNASADSIDATGGSYIVKTDEPGAMQPLTKDQLKTAIDACYSGQTHTNFINELDNFISAQDRYHVNGAYAMAVTVIESGGGTGWDLISPSTYNWYSIMGSFNGGYVDRNGTSWNVYTSYGQAIEEFAKLMTSLYFPSGKIDVETIAPTYCDVNWGISVKAELDKIYGAAGVPINSGAGGGTYSGSTFSYGGKTYTLFKQRDFNDFFGYNSNGARTIYGAGCGATSIAICVSGYMSGQTPSTITSKCSKYGYTCDNNYVFDQWLAEYGLKGAREEWSSNSMSRIIQHIKSGKPVILNIGGTMTLNSGSSESYPYGHFLTLLGVDESGNIFVGDPWGADGWTSQQNILNSGTKGFYLVDKR